MWGKWYLPKIWRCHLFIPGLISIPPLLGWKKDEDLSWFYDILSDKGNKTQMDFLQELQESKEISLKNFTETLETQVYPQCGVSKSFLEC